MSDYNNQIFVSPFLNFDPSVLVTNPNDQYLYLDGTDERSRFERSCCEIGGMVLSGGFFGGLKGLFIGLKDPNIQSLAYRSTRTSQIINYVTKTGGNYAQQLGTIGLIYAISDALIHKARSKDDYMTTIYATTTTGILYKSTGWLVASANNWKITGLGSGWRNVVIGGSLKQMAAGGTTGFLVGLLIATLTNVNQVKSFLG